MLVRQPQFRNANADVQIFYGADATGGANIMATWNKPPGVSHVYMMLIGPGGNGDQAGTAGGSGAVTVWYGAAQNVPDSLEILCHRGSTNTEIRYRTTSTSTNQLLVAQTGSISTGGPAMTANAFCASGFFQSVAGQNGSGGTQIASTTTFLMGGSLSSTTANYGYPCIGGSGGKGYFQLQPIIVGVCGGGTGVGNASNGGIGCGGSDYGLGGPGMVLIASW